MALYLSIALSTDTSNLKLLKDRNSHCEFYINIIESELCRNVSYVHNCKIQPATILVSLIE